MYFLLQQESKTKARYSSKNHCEQAPKLQVIAKTLQEKHAEIMVRKVHEPKTYQLNHEAKENGNIFLKETKMF